MLRIFSEQPQLSEYVFMLLLIIVALHNLDHNLLCRRSASLKLQTETAFNRSWYSDATYMQPQFCGLTVLCIFVILHG